MIPAPALVLVEEGQGSTLVSSDGGVSLQTD